MFRKSTDGPISRHINRRISSKITTLLLKHSTPITPNQLTVLITIVGVIPSLLYMFRDPILAVIAGIIVQLNSILDGVDGEFARATGRTTSYGAFLDATLDRIVDVSILGSIGYVLTLTMPQSTSTVYLVSLAAVTGSLLVSYVHARGEASLKMHPGKIGVACWASRDVRLFLVFLFSLLVPFVGWQSLLACLAIIAVTSYTYVFWKLYEVWRMGVGRNGQASSNPGQW